MGSGAMRARSDHAYAFVVMAALAGSMLTYQILLTRISALRLFFHFSFLVISNCLLGIGAAGTWITLRREKWSLRPRLYVWRACVGYLACLLVSYAFILTFDVPADLRLQDPAHFARFSLFNLVAALPFFACGLGMGMILTFYSHDVNRLYGVDLAAASLGCLASPLALWQFGAGGGVLLVALCALVASVAAAPPAWRRPALAVGAVLGAFALWLLPRFEALFPVPAKGDLELTATVTQNMSDVTEFSRWSATSRIDIVPVDRVKGFLYARGRNAFSIPLPESKFILQDGTAGTLSLNFSEHPESLEALRLSLYSAAVQLQERPRVLVIGVGGGNDVWATRAGGASSVRGIELNRPILDLHRTVLRDYSRDLLEDPRIELVHDEGRSALMRDESRYDLIQMSGIDTWTGLASGAYVLAENYLYTREAIRDMYEHLEEGGMLQIMRFAAAMESLRLLSNTKAALDELGVGGLERSVACLRSPDELLAMIVKKGVFTEGEIRRLASFASEAGLEALYLPGRTIPDLRNLPARFLLSRNKEAFVASFPRDISPTSDDRPYFFNFTRWSDPIQAIELVEEPTYVSQGNPAFILGQLGLSTLLAGGLIVLPLVGSRHHRVDRRHAGRFLAYFSGLGLGFIAIEVALIQKLTLFLGHPVYSITVTLFSILLFAGLGSLCSRRWFEGGGPAAWIVPGGIALGLALFALGSQALVEAAIGLPLAARAAIVVATLAPLAFLLGVPFAYGIRRAAALNPSLVPWAWAVNGSLSVVGSVATVVISMNLGFNAVLFAAVGIYLLAFAALPASPKRSAATP